MIDSDDDVTGSNNELDYYNIQECLLLFETKILALSVNIMWNVTNILN